MYTTASVKRAYQQSRGQLVADLKGIVVYPPFSQFSKDELVSVWLEHYGQRIEEVPASDVWAGMAEVTA